MKRGSTPTHVFNVNIDLREATIYITYSQHGKTIVEKTGDELIVDETTVKSTLTQEDTLKFKNGEVRIQMRYVMPDGMADASNIIHCKAEEILKDGVI